MQRSPCCMAWPSHVTESDAEKAMPPARIAAPRTPNMAAARYCGIMKVSRLINARHNPTSADRSTIRRSVKNLHRALVDQAQGDRRGVEQDGGGFVADHCLQAVVA